MKYTLVLLDKMEGHEFEYAVADLLRHNGFREVQVTQASQAVKLTETTGVRLWDRNYLAEE